MQSTAFWDLCGLSDRELEAGLSGLLVTSSRTEARILAHLAEVEARDVHLKAGYPSLFDYCLRGLGLSENEAFRRVVAARLARRFPIIFELIEGRVVHLTGVCLLRHHLTEGNHRELLAAASHKTKRQIEALLATRFPRPAVESFVRKLPAPRVAHGMAVDAAPVGVTGLDAAACARASGARAAVATATTVDVTAESRAEGERVASNEPVASLLGEPASAQARAGAVASRTSDRQRSVRIEQRSEGRYRIQIDASASLKEKLELAHDLMSHSRCDLAEIVEKGLDLLIERVQKRRFGRTQRPRPREPQGDETADAGAERNGHAERPPRSRERIPNATRRAVLSRDGLRCTYVSHEGQRCSARSLLEIHHEHPWALGGGPDLENLRVLCAAHNRLLAERDFGREHVRNAIEQKAHLSQAK